MSRLVTPPSRRCRWPEQCQYLCWRYHKNRILLLDTDGVGLFETFPFITDFFTSLISGLLFSFASCLLFNFSQQQHILLLPSFLSTSYIAFILPYVCCCLQSVLPTLLFLPLTLTRLGFLDLNMAGGLFRPPPTVIPGLGIFT